MKPLRSHSLEVGGHLHIYKYILLGSEGCLRTFACNKGLSDRDERRKKKKRKRIYKIGTVGDLIISAKFGCF